MPVTHLSRRLVAMLAALGLVISANAGAQQLPAGPILPGPRTGLIVGQVVEPHGAPVADAVVRLSVGGYPEGTAALTDPQGRFFFAELPPGNYYVQAMKEGYTGGVYGQRRPGGTNGFVLLTAGERRTDVTLTLWKSATIAGTVVDEAGEPVVGIGVRALARDVVGGRPSFGNRELPPDGLPTAVTDDRGQFRFSRLLPGAYVVLVPFTLTTLPVGTLDAVTEDRRLGNNLSGAGISDLAGRGEARAEQVGDVAILNQIRVMTPPPPSATGVPLVYPATYFPSSRTAVEATPIVVTSGEERTGITITMRPTPAVRVSGRLVTADGSVPPPMAVRLLGGTAAGVVDMDLPQGQFGPPVALYDTVVGMSDASGRFTLLGVPRGEYVLAHARRIFYPLAAENAAYWISLRIAVGTTDVDNLVVEVKRGVRITGRVAVASGIDASLLPEFLARGAVNFETPAGTFGRFAAELREPNGPRTFGTAAAAGGRYIVRPSESQGWFVESITLDGRDITDRALDLQSDVTSLVVTYTNRPSRVSGSVKDARGATSSAAMVVAFPTNETRWVDYGSSPRIVRSTYPTDAGTYTFEHVPPGEYFVVALEGEDPQLWRDPERLKALSAQATRLTVAAAAPKTLDLVAVRGRQ